jgi:hypothetical protein
MGRKKEEGFLNGKMEINLKEFIKIIWKMAKGECSIVKML